MPRKRSSRTNAKAPVTVSHSSVVHALQHCWLLPNHATTNLIVYGTSSFPPCPRSRRKPSGPEPAVPRIARHFRTPFTIQTREDYPLPGTRHGFSLPSPPQPHPSMPHWRIIPAPAGNPNERRSTARPCPDHPRAGGETLATYRSLFSLVSAGSERPARRNFRDGSHLSAVRLPVVCYDRTAFSLR